MRSVITSSCGETRVRAGEQDSAWGPKAQGGYSSPCQLLQGTGVTQEQKGPLT